MSIKKDGQVYYTMEEARRISDKIILEDAKKFAKEVIRKQKEGVSQENIYA